METVIEMSKQDKVNPIHQKLKTAINALYGVAGLSLIGPIYSVCQIYQVNKETAVFNAENPGARIALASYGDAFFGISAILIVAAIVISRELKEEKAWAYVGALTVFLLGAFSWALPAAVIGSLALLDARVRGEFLKKLDGSL